MKIAFEKYDPAWKKQFEDLKNELEDSLVFFDPIIEHIGSTSVDGLSAKPIIDIMIGLRQESDLDMVPLLLKGKDYVYYEIYNEDMPYRRFFIKLKEKPEVFGFPEIIHPNDHIPEELHNHHIRTAQIHVIPIDSEHWTRHIAFRDYLRTHPDVKKEYQELKKELCKQEWIDGNDYNRGKDPFIKREERRAVIWYQDLEKNRKLN